MVTKALLMSLEAKPGAEEQVETFLQSAVPLVQRETGTSAWYAVRFSRSQYGIFDAFPNAEARHAHLHGQVSKALLLRANNLFASAVQIDAMDVLAHKLPEEGISLPSTKAVLLSFKANDKHRADVEKFLMDAEAFVQEEVGTTAWFAIRRENGDYRIFGVFPDSGARLSHLGGYVPRELAKHALTLLGGMPDLQLIDVQAEKVNQEVLVSVG
jgi:quinol monooxygenase YgiN